MLTVAEVAAALGISPASPTDDAWLAQVVAAVNVYVDALPHVTAGDWDGRTLLGATMLAQRCYAARSAPLGAAGMDVTGAMMKATTDPEVGRMLRTGRYMKPAAG